MKFLYVALVTLAGTTSFLFVSYFLQASQPGSKNASTQTVEIAEPLSEVQSEIVLTVLSDYSSQAEAKLDDPTEVKPSRIVPIDIAPLSADRVPMNVGPENWVEPTPDNADMLATGEMADQVNLTPAPCHSDCADDWDEFAPAMGEYSDQVNLGAESFDDVLPDEVNRDSHPSTLTGSYIDG